MQAERWHQIDEIFQAALDSPAASRTELLDSACGVDAELRREVESLLALHDHGRPTGSSAFEEGIRALDHRGRIAGGSKIGDYCIVREIGHGGMGTVYLAERADEAFHKQVAIKIIRRGLDTDDILQRFRSERQILATLDHANIARLLDGGTTDDGLPYLVMEYIEGEPIDRYCDERKLNITERLKLFQNVCSAVSYAHQNLVVHRDIKPGNVLVTKEGVPRLLDFGIAKLLAPGTELGNRTLTGLRPLTPEYASPEQIRGEPITTASDVYSLGVLLYELLTDKKPYQLADRTPAEMERIVCGKEPERPSVAAGPQANRRLRGDLDNIILMAMRKEAGRRYASAEQLSGDIERYLANLPVIARPDTRGYRAGKFILRNRAWVAMAAIVFLTLAGGLAATLWQAHIARTQRDLARLEQAKAARVNAFLQEMVGYSGVATGSANRKNHDATVEEMLNNAAQRVETELSDQPEVKAEMLGTIGGTYMTQAKLDPAARYLKEAYDLNLKLYGPEARKLGGLMQLLGDLTFMKGDYQAADSWFQKSIPILRKHVNDPDYEPRFFAATLSDAAFVKRALGQLDRAEAYWREALSYGPRIPAKYRTQAIVPKSYLAQLYMDRGDVEKADTLASEASQELRAPGSDFFSLAQSLIDLGNVRRLEARYSEADPLIQEGTSLYAKAQGDDHPNVAYGLTSLATSQYYQGKYDLAEQSARKALKITEKLPKGARQYAAVYVVLGQVFDKTGRSREAEPLLREALAIRERAARRSNYTAIALGELGACLTIQKRFAEAEPLLLESFQTLTALHVSRSPVLKETRERLVSLYAEWGKTPESRRYAQ